MEFQFDAVLHARGLANTVQAIKSIALPALFVTKLSKSPPRYQGLARKLVNLLTGLNADQYAAEMRGQLAR